MRKSSFRTWKAIAIAVGMAGLPAWQTGTAWGEDCPPGSKTFAFNLSSPESAVALQSTGKTAKLGELGFGTRAKWTLDLFVPGLAKGEFPIYLYPIKELKPEDLERKYVKLFVGSKLKDPNRYCVIEVRVADRASGAESKNAGILLGMTARAPGKSPVATLKGQEFRFDTGKPFTADSGRRLK